MQEKERYLTGYGTFHYQETDVIEKVYTSFEMQQAGRSYLIPSEQLIVSFRLDDEWQYIDSIIHRWELGEFGDLKLSTVLEMVAL